MLVSSISSFFHNVFHFFTSRVCFIRHLNMQSIMRILKFRCEAVLILSTKLKVTQPLSPYRFSLTRYLSASTSIENFKNSEAKRESVQDKHRSACSFPNKEMLREHSKLTLSQTTNFRPFQFQRLCRR